MTKHFTTVAEAVHYAEHQFLEAGLMFGHGTDNALDEAETLVWHVLSDEQTHAEDFLAVHLSPEQSQAAIALFERRIHERIPAAYLTQQAWFAGLPFYVDERVIIPRSPIAELLEDQLYPWVDAEQVENILDLCCGSACIAITAAYAFEHAQVDAIDLSADALAVARINVEQHQLQDRVHLYQGDLFAPIEKKRYDIILSNPPYVDADDFNHRAPEFQHEPDMALAAGQDGLDLARQILSQAANHLSEHGILILEVGNSAAALERAYPNTAFTWLEFARGGDGVLLLTQEQAAQLLVKPLST